MRLSDLREAREAAPPPRYGVEDVLMAGRRLRNRRRSAWAAGAAVAVAAVVAVPQAALHRDAPVTEPVAPQPLAFEKTFAGYSAGRFEVRDPTTVGLAHQSAEIEGCLGAETCGLTVLRPGVAVSVAGTRTETDPIAGRPACFLALDDTSRVLVWQYADGAFATLRATEASMTDAEMRRVAEAFRPRAPRPATIGFRLAYVAGGYRLTGVHDGVEMSLLDFERADVAEARMAAPDRMAPEEPGTPRFQVGVARMANRQSSTVELTCEQDAGGPLLCRRWLADGRTLIEASGGPGAGEDELRRMVQAVTVSATAVPVNDAIPASAQLTAE